MVVGAYLISTAHMRIKDEKNGVKFIGLPNGAPPIPVRLTPSTMKERAELVFQLSPRKMKNLVIVNVALSTFKMIQACVEAGEKYANSIIVIPPLLALITYSLEDLSKFQNPPTKEVLLVVTITQRFVDFITLRRDQNFKLYVAEFEHFEDLNQGKSSFSKIYNYCYPHATIFVVHDSMLNVANEIRMQFNPDNCFIKAFKKWDFVYLTGGHLYAMGDEEDGFDSRYHIANFSSGYETSIQNGKTLIYERLILLPNRSALPCKIYGFDGVGQQINVYYSSLYYQRCDDLVPTKRPAFKRPIFASGKAQEVLGYIDERGVPYAKDSAGFNNLKFAQVSKSENHVDSKPFQNPSTSKTIADESVQATNNVSKPHQNHSTFASPPSTSHSKMFVQSHLSSINGLNGRSQIQFLFNENFYAVEILERGFSKMLKDAFGNAWNPLYLSMAHGSVGIGEKAKIHNERFSEYVVYDVLKIIGKPLNKIQIDPKWGFKLVEKDGIIYFQIETIYGPRLFPQEMIIAAFLKSMKLQTESILNIQIKEIRISTNFKLNESQKTIFEKAAAKNNLEILSFDVL